MSNETRDDGVNTTTPKKVLVDMAGSQWVDRFEKSVRESERMRVIAELVMAVAKADDIPAALRTMEGYAYNCLPPHIAEAVSDGRLP